MSLRGVNCRSLLERMDRVCIHWLAYGLAAARVRDVTNVLWRCRFDREALPIWVFA